MSVAENIRKIRKEKSLTQKQLGELCIPKIGESTIRKYELGLLNPKIETLEKIANALGVSVSVFRDFSEYKQNIINNNPALSAYQRLGALEDSDLGKAALQHSIIESLNITEDKQKLIFDYNKLNKSGQAEARKRIEELTEIPKYQKNGSTN